MPLATPSNLQITRFFALPQLDGNDQAVVVGSYIAKKSPLFQNMYPLQLGNAGFQFIDVFAIATWTNSETDAHSVEISTNSGLARSISSRNSRNIQTFFLPKSSTQAVVKLATYQSGYARGGGELPVFGSGNYYFSSRTDWYETECSVSVTLRSGSGASSTATQTATISLGAEVTFGTNTSWDNNTKTLNFPSWNGVVWDPFVSIYDLDDNEKLVWTAKVTKQPFETIGKPTNNTQTWLKLLNDRTYKANFSAFKDIRMVYTRNSKVPISQDGVVAYFAPTVPYKDSKKVVWWDAGLTAFYEKRNNDIDSLFETLFITPEAASGTTFSAVSENVRVVVGQSINIKLRSTHPSTWIVNSGLPSGCKLMVSPGGFSGFSEYSITGTALTAGVNTISVTATRIGTSETSTVDIILVIVSEEVPVNRIQISVNPGWLNNGLSYKVGDNVLVTMSANPSVGIVWSASGLPDGLVIDQSTGIIKGSPSQAGRYIANIVANPIAPGDLERSLPASITFTIKEIPSVPEIPSNGSGESGGSSNQISDSEAALKRVPWILSNWDIVDLQVLARSKVVQSTLFTEKSPLRLKTGDNINFAIFFIDGSNTPFELDPDRLRVTIRPADNLESFLVFESETSPIAVTGEPNPYYLLSASTSGRQRQLVQEWVEDTGKNDPLPCVADVDWTKDGQHFSSASFPVLLELDVTRP